MSQNQPIITQQTVPPIAPIDPKPIIEHGESPTAIILAMTILIATLLGSTTRLVRVVLMMILRQTKSSR